MNKVQLKEYYNKTHGLWAGDTKVSATDLVRYIDDNRGVIEDYIRVSELSDNLDEMFNKM